MEDMRIEDRGWKIEDPYTFSRGARPARVGLVGTKCVLKSIEKSEERGAKGDYACGAAISVHCF
jgi:hypothetical protein